MVYQWTGYFEDGLVLEETEDNSFKDLLAHISKSKLIYFDINDGTHAYGVDIKTGFFGIQGTWFSIEDKDRPLHDRKPVLVVDGEDYNIGYVGTDEKGEEVFKTISVGASKIVL